MSHLAGLDLGTTAVKAAIFDYEGNLAATATVRYPTHHPQPGWAEQDPSDWVRAARAALKKAHDAAGKPPIDAIGLASQRETVTPLDASLRPMRPAIVWMDRRAVPQAREYAQHFGGEFIHRTVGFWPDATYTAPKLRWLSQHDPEAVRSARLFAQPRDYLYLTLTGVAVLDPSLASRTMLLRLDDGGWWQEGLDFASVRAEQFPPLHDSTSAPGGLRPAVATVLGLKPGTPVVVGGGDRPCENLGAGGGLVESSGTTTAISLTLGEPIEPFAGLPLARGVLPGSYSLEPGLGASGSILEWLRGLYGLNPNRFNAFLAALTPGDGSDPVFLPFLAGARGARRFANAKGMIADLTLGHSRESLARAVMSGVAVEVAALLDLFRERGLAVQEVKAVGGGSRSDLWLGLKSGLSGVPFRRSGGDAARGAATLAAMSLGRSLPPPPLGDKVEPIAPPGLRERYEEVLARFRQDWI